MSRIKLLLDVAQDMHALADSLQVLAEAVASDEDMPAAGGIAVETMMKADIAGAAADQAGKTAGTERDRAAPTDKSSVDEPETDKKASSDVAKTAAPAAVKPAELEVKSPTLEEVRKVLAQKSRSGYTAQVRELLIRHGADKLSAVDPKEHAALLAEAEVLGDG